MNKVPTKEQLACTDWWDENDPSGGEATHYDPDYDDFNCWIKGEHFLVFDEIYETYLWVSKEGVQFWNPENFIPRPVRNSERKELENMRDILKKANDIPYSLQDVEQMLEVLG